MRDLLLFIATPLLIIPLALGLQHFASSERIQYFVLAFGAMGHNLPGMMRAYGDRALFQRFKLRFILAPIVFGVMSYAFYSRHSNGIILIAATWAIWHALMQIYGFLRIYAAKVGAVTPRAAWLDFAMCIAWFGGAAVFSDSRLYIIQELFTGLGVGPLSATNVHTLRLAVAAVIGLVTLAYVLNEIQLLRAGSPVSWIKNLLFVTSITFWWWAHVVTADVLLGLILFEVFHDVQYLAIVWVFNRRRVDSDPEVGRFTGFVFRNSWGMVAMYVALVFAYGGFIPLSQELKLSETGALWIATFITTSALLHYYFDGFIWKVRESSTRKSLGLRADAGKSDSLVSSHAAKWLLLLVPAAVMWFATVTPANAAERKAHKLASARALVASTPGSRDAQFDLGVALNDSGLHLESLPYLEAALAILPDEEAETNLALARLQAGKGLLGEGKVDEANKLLIAAYAQRPDVATNCITEGLALWQQKKLDEAILELRCALVMKPDYAEAHLNLALAYRDAGQKTLALRHARLGAKLLPKDANAARLVRQLEGR
jgi:tetratricopeptide (TPR) repeat protein